MVAGVSSGFGVSCHSVGAEREARASVMGIRVVFMRLGNIVVDDVVRRSNQIGDVGVKPVRISVRVVKPAMRYADITSGCCMHWHAVPCRVDQNRGVVNLAVGVKQRHPVLVGGGDGQQRVSDGGTRESPRLNGAGDRATNQSPGQTTQGRAVSTAAKRPWSSDAVLRITGKPTVFAGFNIAGEAVCSSPASKKCRRAVVGQAKRIIPAFAFNEYRRSVGTCRNSRAPTETSRHKGFRSYASAAFKASPDEIPAKITVK